jgi:outer membrane protein
MTSISKIALACAALVAASSAFAQKAGDNIGSLGLAFVNTRADVGTLTNTGPLSSVLNPYLVGSSATIGRESTLAFSWLHMYTDNIGGEVTIGIPPRVRQDLTVPLLPNGFGGPNHPAAANIDVLTPSVVAKYFFGTAQDKWRPYMGLGVSRVSFNDIAVSKSDPTVKALGGTSTSFSSSLAPVYNAGMIYNLDEAWNISGSVSYIPIKTDVTFVGTDGTTTGQVKLKVTDYLVRLGYRF